MRVDFTHLHGPLYIPPTKVAFTGLLQLHLMQSASHPNFPLDLIYELNLGSVCLFIKLQQSKHVFTIKYNTNLLVTFFYFFLSGHSFD